MTSKLKVYVASSWRNDFQPAVVESLRKAGYDVYDFRQPTPDNHGFHWSEIDQEWVLWGAEEFIEALGHDLAEKGFASDMEALQRADAVVLVLPSGRSAHLEAGWAAGSGKPVCIYMPQASEPELMYKMTDAIVVSRQAILQWLEELEKPEPRGCRVLIISTAVIEDMLKMSAVKCLTSIPEDVKVECLGVDSINATLRVVLSSTEWPVQVGEHPELKLELRRIGRSRCMQELFDRLLEREDG